jgi:hypothetical protein
VLLVVHGCALRQWLPLGGPPPGAYSEDDLHADLAEFADRFDAQVSAATDEINRTTTNREIRKRALMMKLHSIPVVQETAYDEDPQHALGDLMVVMILLRHYLTDGDGREILGDAQPIARQAVNELNDDLRAIANKVASPENVAKAVAEIENFARRNSIRGGEFNLQRARKTAATIDRQGALGAIVGVPLAPFRALEGVSAGAAAIHEFNDTAEHFAHIVEALPRRTRWQIELLLYDVEDREAVAQTLAALQSVAASADRAAVAIDRLPADLEAAFDDSEAALAEANRALVAARELMDPLRDTAEQLQRASASWATILARDERATPTGRPFDIREWTTAARQLGATAAELRGLTDELQALTESGRLGSALADATAAADTRMQALVDRAAWRGAQLLAGAFALLVAYRLVAARLRRSPA